MPKRSESDRQQIVQRRLDLLRAELARDWGAADRADLAPAAPARPSAEAVPPPAVGADWWDGRTRIAGLRMEPEADAWPLGDLDADADEPGDGDPVPVPGRHASRRAREWAELVPEPLRGRVELGQGTLALVAVIVALALGVTCWLVVRSSASPVAASEPELTHASPLRSLAAVASDRGTTAPSTPAAASSRIVVDVEGKVRHPGVVELRAGSRVVDAVRAAGGVRRRRDLGGVDLAAPLTDGQQVVVGVASTPAAPAVAGDPTATTGSAPTQKIDLNTATADQLEAIPGIGPVTAQAIVAWREQNGRFTSIDELLEINGIGPAKEADIAPYVTL